MAAGRSQRKALSFRRIWGGWGPLQEKGPQGPSQFHLPGREAASPPGRWRAAPEGALAICLPAPSGGFGGVSPPGVFWQPGGLAPPGGGVPLLGIFRHPAGGVVGSRPDRRVTFLRGQESNQRNRRGPLPAPWTPGAVVRDLQPLLAFNLEPSSGLSAAWVDTRLPPPFGCWNWEGLGFEGPSLLGFSGIPPGWPPPGGGVPPSGISRHPAGGVVGSRPDRRVTFLRGQESNQRNRRGPLPAPWTPGAVVPDLQPLLAFNLEPSSGLSAAWVDTRLPPPLGGAKSRGRSLGVVLLRRVAAGGGDLSGAARHLPFSRGG